VGQSTAASGVKFRPGPSSALGEKVSSGLVWRFGTFDCVSDNLAHFENGFGNSGSFLDVGSHRFYVAKPFPEEVTDVFDPLSDGGSSCGESSSLGAMVKVMALGEEEGGDSPCPERPSPKHLLPQEQDAPLPEQDAPDVSVVDLHAPLSRVIDPARVAEALERTRLALLSKVAEDEANRCRASTTLSEFYDVHGDAPTSLLMTRGAASPLRAPARSSGRHWQVEVAEGADRAAALRAAMPKAAAPSKVVEQAGHARSLCQRQGRSPRLAHRCCTSTCGLTTSRRSLEDLLAQSERLLTKEARGLPAAARGAKRASTPSTLHLTSHASSTIPRAGKRPTPRVSVGS
jgi:hypothetical protein